MELRFYCEPATGQPHIYRHGVSEVEVLEVLNSAGEDLPAARGARMRLGQTMAGRYLQIIYVPDEDAGDVFVISAYELRGKAKKAFRRRLRRRQR